MSGKYQRWNRISPPQHYQAPTGGYWGQVAVIRAHKTRPIARWRTAVAGIVEPLAAVILLLLLRGMIGPVSLALIVAVGLALAVVLMVIATLLGSALAVSNSRWQRGEGR